MLWQVETFPFKSEKLVTRSKQDQEAIRILGTKTTRVEVGGIPRYATPLLRQRDMLLLQAPKEAVMPTLRGVEWRLAKDLAQAAAYKVEMEKLITAGSVIECGPETPANMQWPSVEISRACSIRFASSQKIVPSSILSGVMSLERHLLQCMSGRFYRSKQRAVRAVARSPHSATSPTTVSQTKM